MEQSLLLMTDGSNDKPSVIALREIAAGLVGSDILKKSTTLIGYFLLNILAKVNG